MSRKPPPHRRRARTARPANDEPAFVPPEFEPAQPRPRWDGWTAERQADFIQALAESACVDEACRAVGMSARSAYALRARADAVSFRNAWDTALEFAMRRLTDVVLSRAINGVPRAIFFQGEQIGENRYYDERLAMFLLRYRDPLRYGKWLDRQDHAGHPEGSAIELVAAKRAVREDADLSTRDAPERVSQRLDEIALKMQLMERAVRDWETEVEGEEEGDVARTS